MYPNLTDEEKYSIRQFIKKYEEENGWNEVLHANKETDDYPNYIPNAVFNLLSGKSPCESWKMKAS